MLAHLDCGTCIDIFPTGGTVRVDGNPLLQTTIVESMAAAQYNYFLSLHKVRYADRTDVKVIRSHVKPLFLSLQVAL